jgi:hypothetical protein
LAKRMVGIEADDAEYVEPPTETSLHASV